jgi:roadblock/LC7 domain-containing protein
MQEIQTPKTLKFYQLIKMSVKPTLGFMSAGSSTGAYIGVGFYKTLDEAEFNRTVETLKDTDGNSYHIFELEFPNPVYREC